MLHQTCLESVNITKTSFSKPSFQKHDGMHILRHGVKSNIDKRNAFRGYNKTRIHPFA